MFACGLTVLATVQQTNKVGHKGPVGCLSVEVLGIVIVHLWMEKQEKQVCGKAEAGVEGEFPRLRGCFPTWFHLPHEAWLHVGLPVPQEAWLLTVSSPSLKLTALSYILPSSRCSRQLSPENSWLPQSTSNVSILWIVTIQCLHISYAMSASDYTSMITHPGFIP